MNPKATPRDFFLHLGALIALYVSVGALIDLSFGIIDRLFPDALSGYAAASSIAGPVSMLVVLVPILYVLERILDRDMAKAPEKADIWIRRWRIYLTLFLAGAFIAGDLVALIDTYLNGEITARFACKIVIIVLVAGSVGKYYFFSFYRSSKWSKTARRGNAWFGAALVLASIIGGFAVIGSPAHQRAIRFDAERVSDLQNIQSEIISYWQRNDALPASTTLASVITYGSVADPETNAAYGYGPTGKASFQLCADFDLSSSAELADSALYNSPIIPAGASASNADWTHPAGNYCFLRAIDPAIYPLNKN
jgi:hypothetical protein